mgnify:CR=1 FL=1
MKTVTLSEFLVLLENGDVEWPPVIVGPWIYSRRVTVDASYPQPKHYIVRASLT